MLTIISGLIASVVLGHIRRYVIGMAVSAVALPLAAAAVVLGLLVVPVVLVALFARPVGRKAGASGEGGRLSA
ncbi:MAG TPA: hypothetical protein ENN52_03990 [Methanofollis liminatans]|uniref:Uncharacterized protein n=1 Tax=Methanofollis liminatans TaxID=2201 RepID=A0A831LQA0_9EURY|nr:hypothetical protein [Methanofollis liminatans]